MRGKPSGEKCLVSVRLKPCTTPRKEPWIRPPVSCVGGFLSLDDEVQVILGERLFLSLNRTGFVGFGLSKVRFL